MTVRFCGGPDPLGPYPPSIEYDVPKNTLDPRVEECTDHHVACDCREAELAEQINEWRARVLDLEAAIRDHTAGHVDGCACTGCYIARAVGMY